MKIVTTMTELNDTIHYIDNTKNICSTLIMCIYCFTAQQRLNTTENIAFDGCTRRLPSIIYIVIVYNMKYDRISFADNILYIYDIWYMIYVLMINQSILLLY